MRFKVKNVHMGVWRIVTAKDKDEARIVADQEQQQEQEVLFRGMFGPARKTDVQVQELPEQGATTDEQIAKIADAIGDAVSDAAYPYGDEGAGYDWDDAARFLIAKGYTIIPPKQPEQPDYDGGDAHHACRFCQHALAKHNPIVGCKQCLCAAAVSEARPTNDAELDAVVKP